MKLIYDVKIIVNEWKRKTRGSARFLTEEVKEALVALCVLDLIRLRSEAFPNQPMGPYVQLHDEACKALLIDRDY